MLSNVNGTSLIISIKSIDNMSYAELWELARSGTNSTSTKFRHSFIAAGNPPDRNNGKIVSFNSTVSEQAINDPCAFHKNIEARIKEKEAILETNKMENIEHCVRKLMLSEFKNRDDATINVVKLHLDEYYQLKNKKTV